MLTPNVSYGEVSYVLLKHLNPKQVPYLGSYLPSVIYICDLDIDLARASYFEISRKAEQLFLSVEAKLANSKRILCALEEKFNHKIDRLSELQKCHAGLKAAIDNAEGSFTHNTLAAETKQRLIDEHRLNAAARDRDTYRELLESKRSKSSAKKQFKKLSSLCHPDKTGGDEVLAEIFIAGKLACDLNDDGVLQDLIDQATAYVSGNERKNRLDRFKVLKARATQVLDQAKASSAKFELSFNARIVRAAALGEAQAETMFLAQVDAATDELKQNIRFYEKLVAMRASFS